MLGAQQPETEVGASPRRRARRARAPRGREPTPLAPQPGLDQFPKLIDATRAAGLPVELEIEGEPAPVPPGIDLAAYETGLVRPGAA